MKKTAKPGPSLLGTSHQIVSR